MYIINSLVFMFAISLILGIMIAVFAKVFEVKTDPRIDQIAGILPAYNCGSCGYPGCSQYAEAIISQHVPSNKCTPGGHDLAVKIRAILDAQSAQSAQSAQDAGAPAARTHSA